MRIIDQQSLRQYWAEKGIWEWEFIVQTQDLTIDFLREMRDRMDDLQWSDVFQFQTLDQKTKKEFRDMRNNNKYLQNIY